MEQIIERIYNNLQDCINRYNKDKTEQIKWVLCGMWELADSIKNQLYIDGIEDKKLNDIIDKADKILEKED